MYDNAAKILYGDEKTDGRVGSQWPDMIPLTGPVLNHRSWY